MAFSQIGGARLGLFNATWPLAKLVVDPAELELRVLGIKFTFPKTSITKISVYSALFSKGLRIEHDGNTKAPRFVVFWTFNLAKLTESLSQSGYHVA
jgi:hypothetical protein